MLPSGLKLVQGSTYIGYCEAIINLDIGMFANQTEVTWFCLFTHLLRVSALRRVDTVKTCLREPFQEEGNTYFIAIIHHQGACLTCGFDVPGSPAIGILFKEVFSERPKSSKNVHWLEKAPYLFRHTESLLTRHCCLTLLGNPINWP